MKHGFLSFRNRPPPLHPPSPILLHLEILMHSHLNLTQYPIPTNLRRQPPRYSLPLIRSLLLKSGICRCEVVNPASDTLLYLQRAPEIATSHGLMDSMLRAVLAVSHQSASKVDLQ